jgi:hypothetical protein
MKPLYFLLNKTMNTMNRTAPQSTSHASIRTIGSVLFCCLFISSMSTKALAKEVAPKKEAHKPWKKTQPYSLPWGLRPTAAPTLVRSDTAFGFFRSDAAGKQSTVASTLLAGYSFLPGLGAYIRGAYVYQSVEKSESSGGLANPLLFALYSPRVSDIFRLSFFAGVAFGLGQGGGDSPRLPQRSAVLSGINARSAMDNALFVSNYTTPTVGFDIAYVDHGLTIQGEVTLLQLIRNRGENVDTDATRTNFTTGLHIGYQIVSPLIISAELRHQRWLSTPSFVEKNSSLRDTTTVGIGARVSFKLAKGLLARPGLSYARGLDNPLTDLNYNIIQLDIPILFN